MGVPGGAQRLSVWGVPPVIPLNFTLQVAGPLPNDFQTDDNPQGCRDTNDGIQLIVQVVDQALLPIDVRGSTILQIKLKSPSGKTLDRAATYLTNGLDGKLQYTTVAADLVEDGLYRIQAKYVLAGDVKTTRWGQFRVGPNIDQN